MKKRFFITGIATFLMISLASIQINAQNTDTVKEEMSRTYRPGDHELLFSPTATTMPKGTAYFTSYELILLNAGYSFTDDFQVGIFTLFPVTADFVNTLTVGAKYRLYENENFSFAATSALLFDAPMLNIGGVATYRNEKLTLNTNISFTTVDGASGITTVLGAQYLFTDRFSLIGEYLNQQATVDVFDDDVSGSAGVFFVGARWIAEKMSFDFGGFRPTDGGGELLLIPYIKGTIIF
jgi:hypothetical protein